MKPVRRVVTGFDAEGKSCVIIDGDAPQAQSSSNLWRTSQRNPLGCDPGQELTELKMPAGSSVCRIVDIPPYSVIKEYAERGLPGHDKNGFHRTDSVDYIFIIEGDVSLVLDAGEVLLHPGDCVVQRATNHVWRNDSDTSVRLICAMVYFDGESMVPA